MSDQKLTGEAPHKQELSPEPVDAKYDTKESQADIDPKSGEPKPVTELTAEEQMELYESDLKENDWGHQPC